MRRKAQLKPSRFNFRVGISGVPEVPGAADGLPNGSESDHNLTDAENDDDDDDEIEEIEVSLADLIEDELGDDKMMCCPFHTDSMPSLKSTTTTTTASVVTRMVIASIG